MPQTKNRKQIRRRRIRNQEGRPGEGDRRTRQGQDRPRDFGGPRARQGDLVEGVIDGEAPHPSQSAQADQGRHRREAKARIAISNVMIVTSGGVATRVGYQRGRHGRGAIRRGSGAHRQEEARRDALDTKGKDEARGFEDGEAQTQSSIIKKSVVPALTKEFGYKNVMAVPKIEKVVGQYRAGRSHAERQADGRRGERAGRRSPDRSR